MRKFRFLPAIIAVVACAIASSVAADRLILIPTGDTLSTGGIKAEYMGQLTAGGGNAYWLSVGISRIELEVADFSSHGRTAQALSGQLSVCPETTFMPAIALGDRDFFNSTANTGGLYNGRSFYLAATKTVPLIHGIPLILSNWKFHAGFASGSFSGVFVGTEAGFLGLHLAGEYDTKEFNGSVGYTIIPKVTVDVSTIRNRVFLGAKFSAKI